MVNLTFTLKVTASDLEYADSFVRFPKSVETRAGTAPKQATATSFNTLSNQLFNSDSSLPGYDGYVSWVVTDVSKVVWPFETGNHSTTDRRVTIAPKRSQISPIILSPCRTAPQHLTNRRHRRMNENQWVQLHTETMARATQTPEGAQRQMGTWMNGTAIAAYLRNGCFQTYGKAMRSRPRSESLTFVNKKKKKFLCYHELEIWVAPNDALIAWASWRLTHHNFTDFTKPAFVLF